MSTEIITFASIEKAARALLTPVRIGLVNPDEGLLEAAALAEKYSIAECTTFGGNNISSSDAITSAISAVERGEVDTLCKGVVNTAVFLKSILHSKLVTGYITHTSLLQMEDKSPVLIISDGTVTPKPTLSQKVEIIKNTLLCAETIGLEKPKIALLSANELLSEGVSSGTDAAILCKMAERGQIKCELIDGPMSLDTALSSKAAVTKGLTFRFVPPADILIVPDLESGALLIKAAVHLSNAQVAGILWGTRHPIALTSRADSVKAKYLSICICALAIAQREL